MTDNPIVSILIPLYNAEEYIVETIDSCLNQTYDNIEIIIVDDGSTDSGLSIARQYEKKHANIQVDTQKNIGASAARNRAFQLLETFDNQHCEEFTKYEQNIFSANLDTLLDKLEGNKI